MAISSIMTRTRRSSILACLVKRERTVVSVVPSRRRSVKTSRSMTAPQAQSRNGDAPVPVANPVAFGKPFLTLDERAGSLFSCLDGLHGRDPSSTFSHQYFVPSHLDSLCVIRLFLPFFQCHLTAFIPHQSEIPRLTSTEQVRIIRHTFFK